MREERKNHQPDSEERQRPAIEEEKKDLHQPQAVAAPLIARADRANVPEEQKEEVKQEEVQEGPAEANNEVGGG